MKNYLKLFLILVSFSFGFYVAQAQASEDSSQEVLDRELSANQDDIDALRRVLRLSANQGDSDVQEALDRELSVNQDDIDALRRVLRLSANQGDSDVQEALDRELSANQDDIDALRRVLRLSANQGDSDFLVAEMYYYGRVVKEDREKAYKLYLEAEAKGHEGAKEVLKRKKFQDYQEKTSLSKPDKRNSSCSEIF